jgi:hypothetical protein
MLNGSSMDILKDIKCGIDGYERSYNGYLMDTKIDSDTMMVGPVMPPGTFEVSNGDSPQKNIHHLRICHYPPVNCPITIENHHAING